MLIVPYSEYWRCWAFYLFGWLDLCFLSIFLFPTLTLLMRIANNMFMVGTRLCAKFFHELRAQLFFEGLKFYLFNDAIC